MAVPISAPYYAHDRAYIPLYHFGSGLDLLQILCSNQNYQEPRMRRRRLDRSVAAVSPQGGGAAPCPPPPPTPRPAHPPKKKRWDLTKATAIVAVGMASNRNVSWSEQTRNPASQIHQAAKGDHVQSVPLVLAAIVHQDIHLHFSAPDVLLDHADEVDLDLDFAFHQRRQYRGESRISDHAAHAMHPGHENSGIRPYLPGSCWTPGTQAAVGIFQGGNFILFFFD